MIDFIMFKMNVTSYIIYSQFIPNLNPNIITKSDKVDKNGTFKPHSLKRLFSHRWKHFLVAVGIVKEIR